MKYRVKSSKQPSDERIFSWVAVFEKHSHWSTASFSLEELYEAVLGGFVQVGDSFPWSCFSLGTKS